MRTTKQTHTDLVCTTELRFFLCSTVSTYVPISMLYLVRFSRQFLRCTMTSRFDHPITFSMANLLPIRDSLSSVTSYQAYSEHTREIYGHNKASNTSERSYQSSSSSRVPWPGLNRSMETDQRRISKVKLWRVTSGT